MYYRVFGSNDIEPGPAALLEHLQGLDVSVTGDFRGDARGWFRADLVIAGSATPLPLERFLTTEDDLRGELSAWAAWLETAADNPNHTQLMLHMVSTTQLFTLARPEETEQDARVERLCLSVCQFLARQTAGVYQVDNQGFFAPDGTLLLPE